MKTAQGTKSINSLKSDDRLLEHCLYHLLVHFQVQLLVLRKYITFFVPFMIFENSLITKKITPSPVIWMWFFLQIKRNLEDDEGKTVYSIELNGFRMIVLFTIASSFNIGCWIKALPIAAWFTKYPLYPFVTLFRNWFWTAVDLQKLLT